MRLNLIPLLENEMERMEKRVDGKEARQCTMDCGFCIACAPSSTSRRAFNVRSSKGTRVCTVGIGKTFQISFQAGPFFPSARPYRHPQAHVRPAKCGTSTRDGLTERLTDVLHFISQRDSRFSNFYRSPRSTRVVYLACSASLRHGNPRKTIHISPSPSVRHAASGNEYVVIGASIFRGKWYLEAIRQCFSESVEIGGYISRTFYRIRRAKMYEKS